jgi:hypothetical protein
MHTRKFPLPLRGLSRAPRRAARRSQRLTPGLLESLEARVTLTGGLSANQAFVAQAFVDLLDRQVDSPGLTMWTATLDGGTSRSQVALDIEAGTEYRDDQVEHAYSTLLHRPAESAAVASWAAQIEGGMTVEQLDSQIAASPEYYQNRAGRTASGFINAAYNDALGRPADSAGEQLYALQIANGQSRTFVAYEIFNSTEANRDLTEGFYQEFLHRPADQEGLSAAVSLLSSGVRDETIIAGLIASDEYAARVPAAPPVPALAPSSPSNGSTPTLVGSTERLATVSIYDGAMLLGTTPSDLAGDWSFTTGSLLGGPHDFTVTATNALGNKGPASTSLPYTVATGPTQLHISGQPTAGVAGTALAPITAAVEDADGELVTTATGPITVSVASGPGTLTGITTVNPVDGVATFDGLLFTKTGTYTLTLSSTGLRPSTTTTFTVAPATASVLSIITQPVNTTFGILLNPVVVAVEDAFGNVVAANSEPITVTINSGLGLLAGVTTVDAINGVATFDGLIPAGLGTNNTLSFSGTGLTSITSEPFSID